MADKIIVGIGELLWDEFPEYSKPGGAPANFAYNINQLGSQGFCVTAIGADEKGKKLIHFLDEVGLDTSFVQKDGDHPTGKVTIEFDGDEPIYTIHEDVAWDHITWNNELLRLAKRADAVCFSTLSQRSKASRKAIRKFLKNVSTDCIRVLDLNLRPPFYSTKIIKDSLNLADVLKLNEEESKQIADILETEDLTTTLFTEYGIEMLCITLGANGSKFITPTETIAHEGFKVDTSEGDVVGVGDAFIACITYHLVHNTPLSEALEKANRYASYMVIQAGAMNKIPKEFLRKVR